MVACLTFSVCCGFYCDLKGSYAYTTGYHAVATDVHYVAITPQPLTTEPLFNHDISVKAERVANLVHLIRLGGVLAWLGQQLDSRNRPEFVPFERYVPTLVC